jgi:predicted RNase H-like HicB family nuclease
MDNPRVATEDYYMKYKVALHKSDEGYAVSVPGLPGCWSQGLTEAEALANVQEAIREYLEVASELVKGADVREVEVKG